MTSSMIGGGTRESGLPGPGEASDAIRLQTPGFLIRSPWISTIATRSSHERTFEIASVSVTSIQLRTTTRLTFAPTDTA